MKFHQEERLICWWPNGLIDRDRALRYFQQLGECEWGHKANRFCDFSNVSDFELDYKGISSLAAQRKAKLKEHRDVTLVVYSTSALGFGMARMYQTMMEGWPVEVHVERNLDRCAFILDVPVELLKPPGDGEVEEV